MSCPYKVDPVYEFPEFNSPSGLLQLIGTHRLEVLEVSLICTYFNPVLRALQVVRPVLEGSHDGQKFLFVDYIVLFGRRELLR